jgi:hypothetical protein
MLAQTLETGCLNKHVVAMRNEKPAQFLRHSSAAAADGRKFIAEYEYAHRKSLFDGLISVIVYYGIRCIQRY